MAPGSDASERSTRSARGTPAAAAAAAAPAPVPAPEAAAAPAPTKKTKARQVPKNPKSLSWRSGIPTAWDPEVEDSTEVGFPNTQVQCYRNATLQLLLHAPVLCNWLNWYKKHHAPQRPCKRGEKGKECKVCQFQTLCATYWDAGAGDWKAALNKISDSVYAKWRKDAEDEQSDLGEYLEQIVEQLIEDTKPMFRCDIDNALKVEIFDLKQCIGDKGCNPRFTPRKEVFLRLEWPDKPGKSTTIMQMMDKMFTKEDKTRGKCGECGNPTSWTERLGHPPDLLLVSVNRLDMLSKKIHDQIKIMEKIALSGTYFDERAATKEKANQSIKYELTAVVLHEEAEAGGGGHYTIAVKGRGGTWKLLNDTKITDIDFGKLKSKEYSQNAHIFSYRRFPTYDDAVEKDSDLAMRDSSEEPITESARSVAVSFNQGSSGSADDRSGQSQGMKELVASIAKSMVPAIYKVIKDSEAKEKEKEKEKETEKGKGTKEKSTEAADEPDEPDGDGSDGIPNPLDFDRGRGTLRITVSGEKEGDPDRLDIFVRGLVHNKIEEDKRVAEKKEAAKKPPKSQKRQRAATGGRAKAKFPRVGKGKGKGKSKEPVSNSESELSEALSLSGGNQGEKDEEYQA
ncbi:hypothetical protein PENANT_c034G11383 [Penicillium antarcticum]|uniref:USP domain-containing protein n=1 Tax=Penicillium antarcticum TaxID=416450 RepID=A0A1V6PVU1_9EURO|nr:uncharacterized protein N7508_001814 [Penicillium antarcticum]KAJ5317306.1 hypothetical protein N7508_001814 [Penicillium antarcticum]OQD80616.1 hypothetical protein PENANT_c034G11383 [Penicillium antarcticum]